MLVFFWPFRCWQETSEKLWFFLMSSFSAGANKIKDLAVGKEKKKTKSRVTNNKSWQSSVEKKKRASYRSGRSEYVPCLFPSPLRLDGTSSRVCVWWEWWPCCGQRDQTKQAPANSDEDCLIYQIFKKNKNKTKTQCQKTGGPVPY